mmetsp:Transcript_159560/g.306291  ORF Transcript_159560/g.306291 Transcript_159560/m.306291 type:complete len:523 (-) Transcript_159560:84-1652(-)
MIMQSTLELAVAAELSPSERVAQLEAELERTKKELEKAQSVQATAPNQEQAPPNANPHTEWWESVMDLVAIKSMPDPDAADVGFLNKGQQIQVIPPGVRSDGLHWVQLTDNYIKMCCAEEHSGPGFILVDATSIQGGVHLHGPNAQSTLQNKNLRDEWYEAVKSTVLIKEKPNKDSKSVALIREGRRIQVKGARVWGEDGHPWVELTIKTLARLCETPTFKGYALIDGTHLGVGVLLRGPIGGITDEVSEEWHQMERQIFFEERVLAQQKAAQRCKERNEQKAEENRKKLREQQAAATGEFLDRAKNEAERNQERAVRMRLESTVYRAQYDHVYIKRSGGSNPESARVDRCSCRPGAALYTTGVKWSDSSGGEWLQHKTKPGYGKVHGWMLVQGAGFGIDGPFMIQESQIVDHVHIRVNFLASIGEFTVYDTFLHVSTKIKTLKNCLGKATGLQPKSLMLLKPEADSNEVKSKNLVNDSATLESVGFTGGKATLSMLYLDDFTKDFVGFAPEVDMSVDIMTL